MTRSDVILTAGDDGANRDEEDDEDNEEEDKAGVLDFACMVAAPEAAAIPEALNENDREVAGGRGGESGGVGGGGGELR